MKWLLIFTVSFLLFSCTSSKKVMNSWMGNTKQNLIFKWGPPAQTTTDGNGGEILIYAGHAYGNMGTTVIDYWEYKLFYVNKENIIYHWIIKQSPNPPTTVNVRLLAQ